MLFTELRMFLFFRSDLFILTAPCLTGAVNIELWEYGPCYHFSCTRNKWHVAYVILGNTQVRPQWYKMYYISKWMNYATIKKSADW